MKTKIIPFDLETAKKIQAGEIEGRIVTYKGDAKVLSFDIKNKEYPIAAAFIGNSGNEVVDSFATDGKCSFGAGYSLFIELPEEAPKHEFKPFDKVLVRESDEDYWHPDFFIMWHGQFAECVGIKGGYVIPYEGNEHLVGTTDKPKED